MRRGVGDDSLVKRSVHLNYWKEREKIRRIDLTSFGLSDYVRIATIAWCVLDWIFWFLDLLLSLFPLYNLHDFGAEPTTVQQIGQLYSHLTWVTVLIVSIIFSLARTTFYSLLSFIVYWSPLVRGKHLWKWTILFVFIEYSMPMATLLWIFKLDLLIPTQVNHSWDDSIQPCHKILYL